MSGRLAIASDVSAIVTISDKPDTCAIEVAGGSPPKFDVPCSEVGMTLFQLSVAKGSAVFLRILGPLTKEQSAALRKQLEDAGYVLATMKVGFLTEPQK
jgi:6,7-dimethyl-8-ribityllumazine synthase